MKEFRLTFAGEDFAVVSQALVAMGVSFHVFFNDTATTEIAVAESRTRSAARAHASTKGARKATTAHRTKQSKPEALVPPASTPIGAADRLRDAIARSGNAYRSVMEPVATVSESGTTAEPDAPTGE